MQVKGTVKAWATNNCGGIDQIDFLIEAGKSEKTASILTYTNIDMSQTSGWTEVGVATITVDFFPREAIVSKQIDGLREQLRQHLINAELGKQAIEAQISKLLAIAA